MFRMLKLILCYDFYECLRIQAEKLVKEMENKCNEKILENKQDSERYLMRLKEEHGTMVSSTSSIFFISNN
jgi:hypothetical protein